MNYVSWGDAARFCNWLQNGQKPGIEDAGTTEDGTIAAAIIALERAALDRWGQGDPSGFLEVVDDEVGYFDQFLPARLDGRAALEDYYAGSRGKISAAAPDWAAARGIP